MSADVLSGKRMFAVEQGDNLGWLRSLPDRCCSTICTSPPYYGLRDYQTGQWEGGDSSCDHRQESPRFNGPKQTTAQVSGHASAAEKNRRHTCHKCGAVRIDQQIGLEERPDCLGWATGEPCGCCYVCRLVGVFREARRVLHPSGTLWLNLGDSFAGGGGGNYSTGTRNVSGQNLTNVRNREPWLKNAGVKAKDLLGIPWRVAFALQADGWYLRSCINWNKISPMPESVKDRPTRATEQIFLLTPSARYFYDMEAERVSQISAPHSPGYVNGADYAVGPMNRGGHSQREDPDRVWGGMDGRNLWDWWECSDDEDTDEAPDSEAWKLSTEPQKIKHYATFPTEIPRRCIRLGSSLHGVCPTCHAPWTRQTSRKKTTRERPNELTKRTGEDGTGNHCPNTTAGVSVQTLGWSASCLCGGEKTLPSLVIDPFCGSGTTGLVARLQGRRFLGCDLSDDYCRIARQRIGGATPLFDSLEATS